MTEQSPHGHAAQAAKTNSWFTSPFVLLAGVILIAAIIAAVVVGGGSDESADDQTATDDTAAVASAADETDDEIAGDESAAVESSANEGEAIDAPETETSSDGISNRGRFGGPSIPETAPVTVDGGALPAFNPSDDPAVGVVAPVVTAMDLASGEPTSLEPGARRMIVFVAHWCPHCRDELPQLTSWLESGALPDDVEVVAVSTSVRAEAENYPPSDWFNAEAWPGEVIVDDDASTALLAYGFEGFPAFIALDENGEVLARTGGNVGVDGFNELASAFS